MTDKPTPLQIYEHNMMVLSLSSNPAHSWAWNEITKQGEEVCLMGERLNDMCERWENDQDTIQRLTKERDEARQELSKQLDPIRPDWYAEDRGWDCFKENKDVG